MQRKLWALAFAAGAMVATSAYAQAPVEVTLTRLACGDGFNDQRRFSDSYAYHNEKVPFRGSDLDLNAACLRAFSLIGSSLNPYRNFRSFVT